MAVFSSVLDRAAMVSVGGLLSVLCSRFSAAFSHLLLLKLGELLLIASCADERWGDESHPRRETSTKEGMGWMDKVSNQMTCRGTILERLLPDASNSIQ